MKTIKKLTAMVLVTCILLFLTTAAQASEKEIRSTTDYGGDFIATDSNSDIESKVGENGFVHWSDILGYDIDTVQKELVKNQSTMVINEQDDDPYGERRGTFTKEELEEWGMWEADMESYKPYTAEESGFIIEQLLSMKEPEDTIVFDHGDIYLDINWRGKNISSEGYPNYMSNNFKLNLLLDFQPTIY